MTISLFLANALVLIELWVPIFLLVLPTPIALIIRQKMSFSADFVPTLLNICSAELVVRPSSIFKLKKIRHSTPIIDIKYSNGYNIFATPESLPPSTIMVKVVFAILWLTRGRDRTNHSRMDQVEFVEDSLEYFISDDPKCNYWCSFSSATRKNFLQPCSFWILAWHFGWYDLTSWKLCCCEPTLRSF